MWKKPFLCVWKKYSRESQDCLKQSLYVWLFLCFLRECELAVGRGVPSLYFGLPQSPAPVLGQQGLNEVLPWPPCCVLPFGFIFQFLAALPHFPLQVAANAPLPWPLI